MWEGLESLTIPWFCSRMEHMEVIGTYCKNLLELKIDCQFDLNLACALTKNFRKLKVVSLRCKTVHNEALIHILDNSENLDVLNISHCLFIQFEKRLRNLLHTIPRNCSVNH